MVKLFITLMFIVGTAYSAGSDFSYYICAEKANIYASPESNSEVFTTLPFGTKITPIFPYVSTKDGWTFVKIQINKQDGYVSEKGFFQLKKDQVLPLLILKLPLKNGKNLEFKNNYCDVEQRSATTLISHEKELGFYILKTVVYEGGATLLVDDKNGAKYRIYGYNANLIFSPNKKKFFVSHFDVYGEAYHLAIYSISQRKPVLKFEKTSTHRRKRDFEWDLNEIKWLSNNTIEYMIKSKTGQTPKLIKFNGKKWIEQ